MGVFTYHLPHLIITVTWDGGQREDKESILEGGSETQRSEMTHPSSHDEQVVDLENKPMSFTPSPWHLPLHPRPRLAASITPTDLVCLACTVICLLVCFSYNPCQHLKFGDFEQSRFPFYSTPEHLLRVKHKKDSQEQDRNGPCPHRGVQKIILINKENT